MYGRTINPVQPAKSGHPHNRGKVGWWLGLPGQSGGGTLFNILSPGSNINGALTNAPTWGTSPFGFPAINFTAASSMMVNCGTPTGLNSAVQAAYAAWIWKPSNSVSACLGGTGGSTGGGNRFSSIWFTDGNVYTNAEGAANDSYGSFAGGSSGWHRLFAKYDGSLTGNANRLKVWWDGVPKTLTFAGAAGIPAALGSGTGPWTLGRDSSNRYGSGAMLDVQLWTGVTLGDDFPVYDYRLASMKYLTDSPLNVIKTAPIYAVAAGGTNRLLNLRRRACA